MKNRFLALLLIMCLSGTMIPALAEDAISVDEGIEAPVPEISEDDAAILLEDTDTTEDDEPEAPVEITEIEEPLSDAISAESAAASLSVGYARVIEAVSVYDDASELIRESLPVDAVVYVETVADDRAQVAFASVDGIVRGWMDAAALIALDEAEVSALYASAEADPEAYRFIDDTLPLPLFDAVVEPLALSQTLAALSPGDALTLTVADGRAVTWFSEDEAVATVSEDGTVTAVSMGETNIFAVDADGQTVACEVRVTLLTQAAVMPDAVRFNVSKLNIGLGEVSDALQVILGSETGVDYIRELTFESAKTKYVTVNADGQLVGVKKGSSTITVRTSNGLKATCKVTVKSAPGKVTITPSALTLNAGETKALTGKLNSSSAAGAVTWSSSDEAVATVDASTGKVTAIAAGSAVITAKTYNDKTATATVKVRPAPESLAFDEPELTLGVKQKVTLAAKLNPGAECEIKYATSDPKVVSIKGNTFTAAAAGTATITASTYNGLQATCVIHVEGAPKSVSLPFKTLYLGQGDTFQLEPVVDGNASGLTYKAEKTKYVKVTSGGLVTAVSPGTSYVTIKTYNDKKFKLKVIVQKAPTSLTVAPTSLELAVGEREGLSFKVSAGSHGTIAISSDNTDVATVDDNGLVTAVSVGTATITGETYNGLKATCRVTVNPAPTGIAFTESDIDVSVGETYALEVELTGGKSRVSYSSADAKVATVSASGVVTAKAPGRTVIRATTINPEIYAEATVNVWGAPDSVKLNFEQLQLDVNETRQLEPVIPDNTRTTYTYTTSDPLVAKVDADGVVTGLSLGTATITVKTHNGKTAKLTVNVVDPLAPTSIVLLEDVPTLEIGQTWQLSYEVRPDTAIKDLAWSSSNESVATVDADGQIVAVGRGSAAITATALRNSRCRLTINVRVKAVGEQELCTDIPKRITGIDGIPGNLAMIEAIRQSALYEIRRLEDEDEISASDAARRTTIVNNVFENYAFPWMTLKYQDYWKAKNSEGGVKDFKPGNVYYGLPYISGTGTNRRYNKALALSENRYYDSGNGYYILNQNKLLNGKYVGNDCSGLMSVAIWDFNSKRINDHTDDIATNSAYRTISSFKAMRPGDMICKGDAHVVMFLYYVNEERTRFMMIENGGAEKGTNTVHCDIYDADYYISRGYKVRRLATLG